MWFQQTAKAANCLLVLVLVGPSLAFPKAQSQLVQFGNDFTTESMTETATDLGLLSTTEMTNSTENATESTTTDAPTTPRDQNPVFNVWEYALGYHNPVDTRAAQPEEAQPAEEGNECMWAIITCCDAETVYYTDSCFEALGCGGAWFTDLCSDDFVDAANNQVFSLFDGGFGKK